jgi:hypothetical protein
LSKSVEKFLLGFLVNLIHYFGAIFLIVWIAFHNGLLNKINLEKIWESPSPHFVSTLVGLPFKAVILASSVGGIYYVLYYVLLFIVVRVLVSWSTYIVNIYENTFLLFPIVECPVVVSHFTFFSFVQSNYNFLQIN